MNLPLYMIPSYFIELDTIPLTNNGKVDRKKLPNVDNYCATTARKDLVEPITDNERAVLAIVKKLLNNEVISMSDNFFSLGGHSVLVMMMIHELSLIGLSVNVSDVFLASSLKVLAAHCTSLIKVEETSLAMSSKLSSGLSPSQAALYYLQIFEPTSTFYNYSSLFNFEADVDFIRFEKACKQLIERHASFRTLYKQTSDGKLIQTVKPVDEMFYFESCEKLAISELRSLPVDLENGPIMKFYVSSQQFLMVTHHICIDGSCDQIVLDDLAKLYNNVVLEPLQYSYIDYSSSVTQDNSSLDYFVDRISGKQATELPTDFVRPTQLKFTGESVFFNISAQTVHQLERICQQNSTTLNSVMMTIFCIWLYKHTNQKDLLFGLPTHGRWDGRFNDTVGYFVNPLPIDVLIDENQSFNNLLKQVIDANVGVLKHQQVFFDQIVDKLDSRVSNRNPVFNIMFNMLMQTDVMPKFDGFSISPCDIGQAGSKLDMTFSCMVQPNKEMKIELEYSDELFSKQSIESMMKRFNVLVDEILKDNLMSVKNYAILPSSEKLFLHSFNPLPVSFPETTIHGLIEDAVDMHAEKTAIADDHVSYTYRDANAKANRLARHLQTLNNNTTVGVCMERCADLPIVLWAILKSGAAYLPLDPAYPSERLRYFVEHSETTTIIGQPKFMSIFEGLNMNFINIEDSSAWINNDSSNLNLPVNTHDLMYVIYTSGSTGTPKGVCVEHRSVVNRLLWKRNLGFCAEDRIIQKTPYSFDVSVWELFAPFLFGATLCLLPAGAQNNPDEIIRFVSQHKITVMHFVASMLGAFLEFVEPGSLPSLRLIVQSGEALPSTTAQTCLTRLGHAELYNLYGPTETTIDSSFFRCTLENIGVAPPIGRPVANNQLYVLDKNMQLCAIGVAGELYIAGDGLARGYYKQPELTASRFVPCPFPGSERMYKTGDLVHWTRDGNLVYVGRVDQQVKIRGNRIELGEIEVAITSMQVVQQTIVVVNKDEELGQRLVAYLLLVSEANVSSEAVRQHLGKTLPEYMIPSLIITLKSIPLTPAGKANRKLLSSSDFLSQHMFASAEPITTGEKPRTNNEVVLAGIWSDLLKVPNVNLDDNFFKLGGDSILSLQLVSRARAFDIQITPQDIFRNPVLRRLALIARIQENQKTDLTENATMPLWPIHKWFFEQKHAVPEYFNQAFVIRCPGHVHYSIMQDVLQVLISSFSSLRMSLSEDQQSFKFAEAKDVYFDLPLIETTKEDLINEGVTIQTEIILTEAPLARALLLRTSECDYLTLVLHHFIVDAVSWHVLIPEINRIYLELSTFKKAKNVALNVSLGGWRRKLEEWTLYKVSAAEKQYWHEVILAKVDHIAHSINKCTYAEAPAVEEALNVDETKLLVNNISNISAFTPMDVIFTAVVLGLNKIFDISKFRVNLEGHGRDFEGMDVSNNVMWFTTIYPVLVELQSSNVSMFEKVRMIKQLLKRVPQGGIGYQNLRYLTDEYVNAESITEIGFNYLGVLTDETTDDASDKFEIVGGVGSDVSKKNTFPYVIDFNIGVFNGILSINVNYNSRLVSEKEAKLLVKETKLFVKDICSCILTESASKQGWISNDFGFTLDELSMNINDFTSFFDEIKDLEIISPVSSIQKGMILRYLMNNNTDEYFERRIFKLSNDINLFRLKQAFIQTFDIHPMLRSQYLIDFDEPLFYVRKNISFDWKVIKLPAAEKSDIIEIVNDCMFEEAKEKFDLRRKDKILHRFVIIDFEKEKYMLWLHHHLTIDGYSTSLLFNDVVSFYNGIGLTVPMSNYRDYIKHVFSKPIVDVDYWKPKMSNVSPCNLPLLAKPTDNVTNKRIIHELPSKVFNDLSSLVTDLGIPLTSTIVLSWSITLALLTSAKPVFGLTLSGRSIDLVDIDKIIGPFVNTLPLVTDNLNGSIRQLLHKTNEDIQELNAHSTDELIEVLNLARKTGVSIGSLFDTLLVFDGSRASNVEEQTNSDVPFEVIDGADRTEFPLVISVSMEEGITFKATYIEGNDEYVKYVLDLFMNVLYRIPTAQNFNEIKKDLLEEYHFNNSLLNTPSFADLIESMHGYVKWTDGSLMIDEKVSIDNNVAITNDINVENINLILQNILKGKDVTIDKNVISNKHIIHGDTKISMSRYIYAIYEYQRIFAKLEGNQILIVASQISDVLSLLFACLLSGKNVQFETNITENATNVLLFKNDILNFSSNVEIANFILVGDVTLDDVNHMEKKYPSSSIHVVVAHDIFPLMTGNKKHLEVVRYIGVTSELNEEQVFKGCQGYVTIKTDDEFKTLTKHLTSSVIQRLDNSYQLVAISDVKDLLNIEETIIEDYGFNSIDHYKIGDIMSKLLRVPIKHISSVTNFFHIGGHSLLVMKLLSQLKRELNISISINKFNEEPTIEGIIKNRTTENMNQPIKTSVISSGLVNKPNLFLIHSGNGTATEYLSLLDKVQNFNIVALADPLFGNIKEMHFASMKALVDSYLKTILEIQPSGPYFIGGYSFGGNAALLVAQQLEKTGSAVDSVVIIDSHNPINLKSHLPVGSEEEIIKQVMETYELDNRKTAIELRNEVFVLDDLLMQPRIWNNLADIKLNTKCYLLKATEKIEIDQGIQNGLTAFFNNADTIEIKTIDCDHQHIFDHPDIVANFIDEIRK
eukprot:TRINITY_DN3317_c0_g1_i3.p1 TRINITY_DN3317_c0_g1~~TRINITY_DN3317_c0_g1_i3.p1  ORF type:complete len:3039 (-),score=771.85 TRINITY_DN3317_c0_g1_i3:50-7987(-)